MDGVRWPYLRLWLRTPPLPDSAVLCSSSPYAAGPFLSPARRRDR